jgi:hypothetical protein
MSSPRPLRVAGAPVGEGRDRPYGDSSSDDYTDADQNCTHTLLFRRSNSRSSRPGRCYTHGSFIRCCRGAQGLPDAGLRLTRSRSLTTLIRLRTRRRRAIRQCIPRNSRAVRALLCRSVLRSLILSFLLGQRPARFRSRHGQRHHQADCHPSTEPALFGSHLILQIPWVFVHLGQVSRNRLRYIVGAMRPLFVRLSHATSMKEAIHRLGLCVIYLEQAIGAGQSKRLARRCCYRG